MKPSPYPWAHVRRSLRLFAVDPVGLGGIVLRARAGPARDVCVATLPDLGLPHQRLHPSLTDAELFASMDFAATLAKGQQIYRQGLLHRPAAYHLCMAERCHSQLAAKLTRSLDEGHSCLIAFDEGAEPEETLAPALADRLALRIDLTDLRACDPPAIDTEDLNYARALLPAVQTKATDISTLVHLSARLGIPSLRAPSFALKAARCNAALSGRMLVETEDLEIAATLVLAHRATCLPAPEPEAEAPTPEQPVPSSALDSNPDQDVLVEAVRMVLPEGILPHASPRRAGATGTGAGDARIAKQRGRPIASRRRRPDGRSRVDLIATLRMAAPWQKLRRAAEGHVSVLPSDICLKRFETQTERLLIFLVDASGSAARARLNEAKGAVEHLLARAYSHRDHVALIGFRNDSADVLLPPNRSLVLAKRRLAALPGGGATPLADGLQCAGIMAGSAHKRGMTPTVILLTDGRANVALDGQRNRQKATEDAEHTADWLRASKIRSVVLDTAIRPQKALQSLAHRMGADHVALPRATTVGLTQAIETAVHT
ncbi:magnesium chelatase subunit D [Ruegeria sp. THAF33]|uniref:magnesium chelatase subunit D n=1 Tax=Ruegeria sp. THAF33 TaxID=2587853 RepID=UPI001267A882|nr:magnesium chelatase subunit D [Ruegeria sp. THAF33]QFT73402.1 Magnesium-chelatase 60 kDa subunit [Ruegeria sp. THAF33]